MTTVGQMARGALPMAIFLTVVPGLLLLGEDPGSAAFVITVFTLVLGVVFLIIVVAALRFSRRAAE